MGVFAKDKICIQIPPPLCACNLNSTQNPMCYSPHPQDVNEAPGGRFQFTVVFSGRAVGIRWGRKVDPGAR